MKLIYTEKNKQNLRELIQRAKLTQPETARLLAKETGRPCSTRSIQAWLANSERSTALQCPDWVVIELQRALLRQKNHSLQIN